MRPYNKYMYILFLIIESTMDTVVLKLTEYVFIPVFRRTYMCL
jgi:hypothetical protein